MRLPTRRGGDDEERPDPGRRPRDAGRDDPGRGATRRPIGAEDDSRAANDWDFARDRFGNARRGEQDRAGAPGDDPRARRPGLDRDRGAGDDKDSGRGSFLRRGGGSDDKPQDDARSRRPGPDRDRGTGDDKDSGRGGFLRRGRGGDADDDEKRASSTGRFAGRDQPSAGRRASGERGQDKNKQDDEKKGGPLGRFSRGRDKDEDKKGQRPGPFTGGSDRPGSSPRSPGGTIGDRDRARQAGAGAPGDRPGMSPRPSGLRDRDADTDSPGARSSGIGGREPYGAARTGPLGRDRDESEGARAGPLGRDRDQPGSPVGGGLRDREPYGAARSPGSLRDRDEPGGIGAGREPYGASPRRPGSLSDEDDQDSVPGARRPGSLGDRDAADSARRPGGVSPGFGDRPGVSRPGAAGDRSAADAGRRPSGVSPGAGDRPGMPSRSASQSRAMGGRSSAGTRADDKEKKGEGGKSRLGLGRFSRGKDKAEETKDRSSRRPGQGDPTRRGTTGDDAVTAGRNRPGAAGARQSQDTAARRSPLGGAERGARPTDRASRSRPVAKPLPESKARSALTVHQGLDFERKIDLVGVALVGFALVAFFAVVPSVLFGLLPEPQTGLTGSLNHLLSQLFGWGKVVWPVIAFGIGVWLMAQSFASTGIELDYFRVVGMLSLYACALTWMQMLELVNDVAPSVEAFKPISRALAIDQGRGGGWFGHTIYVFLLSQLADGGTVSVLIAWLVMSLMLTFDLSVVELLGYLTGAFAFLRIDPQARARKKAAQEALTADIVAAMRPGETELRPLTPRSQPAAAGADQPADPNAPPDRPGRRLGPKRSDAPMTETSALSTATLAPAHAPESPAPAPETEPGRDAPVINRRAAAELNAAGSVSPAAEPADDDPRSPARRRMPHLRRTTGTMEAVTGEEAAADPRQTRATSAETPGDPQTGRRRLGLLRRGSSDDQEVAETTTTDTPAVTPGVPPAIPVPTRRQPLTGTAEPGRSEDSKPGGEDGKARGEADEGQRSRRLGLGLRRSQPDAESAIQDSQSSSDYPGRRPLPGPAGAPDSPATDRPAPVERLARPPGASRAVEMDAARPETPDRPSATDRAALADSPLDRRRERVSPLARPSERSDDANADDLTPRRERVSPLARPSERPDEDASEPGSGNAERRGMSDALLVAGAAGALAADRVDRPSSERRAPPDSPARETRVSSSLAASPDRATPEPPPSAGRDRAGQGLDARRRIGSLWRRSGESAESDAEADAESRPDAPSRAPVQDSSGSDAQTRSATDRAARATAGAVTLAPADSADKPPDAALDEKPAQTDVLARRRFLPGARPRSEPDAGPDDTKAPVETPEASAEPLARPRAGIDLPPRRAPVLRRDSDTATPTSEPARQEPTGTATAEEVKAPEVSAPEIKTPQAETPPARQPGDTVAPESRGDTATQPASAPERPAMPARERPAIPERGAPSSESAPRAESPPTPAPAIPPVRPRAGEPPATSPLRSRSGEMSAASAPRAESPASSRPAVQAQPGESPTAPPRRHQEPAAPLRRTQEPAVAAARGQNAPQSRATARASNARYELPDFRKLLREGDKQRINDEILLDKARVIEDTLTSFGAPGKVVEVNPGPVITQFGIEPGYLDGRAGKRIRVKVGAIGRLDADLALALAAKTIRIEAPVPGKGYVGIEVPNDEVALVGLRDIMDSPEFQRIDSKLRIALGLAVDGTPVAADLTAMPHLLIAGTTGSGKSVCVNSIISCLLLENTPEDVQLIMVDPKRVELTGYNGIPHLVAPVVVDLERIVGVLQWIQREMEERYRKFSAIAARNILDYNTKIDPGMTKMPYYVVIVDELADLMMLAPDETERLLARLAQMARATGIHLIISTQRPSVDIITGLIKANFPARIAFAVASSVDSRVILDQPGAEKLLGRGDMLYQSPDAAAPLRMQGVFVSDEEIMAITRYWRGLMLDDAGPREALPSPGREIKFNRVSAEPAATAQPRRESQPAQTALWDDEGAASTTPDENTASEDELYEEAVKLVQRLNKASISLLQRRLRIGYTRAARLIDLMEQEGIVGPSTEGSKPRDVLKPRIESGDD